MHSISHSAVQFFKKGEQNQTKKTTTTKKQKLFLVQGRNFKVWLAVVLRSGALCLEQPSSLYPTLRFTLLATLLPFSMKGLGRGGRGGAGVMAGGETGREREAIGREIARARARVCVYVCVCVSARAAHMYERE